MTMLGRPVLGEGELRPLSGLRRTASLPQTGGVEIRRLSYEDIFPKFEVLNTWKLGHGCNSHKRKYLCTTNHISGREAKAFKRSQKDINRWCLIDALGIELIIFRSDAAICSSFERHEVQAGIESSKPSTKSRLVGPQGLGASYKASYAVLGKS
jgi:hypothetical protein